MAAKHGQHFLINKHAVDRIIDALALTAADTVLEIGPGKGALTPLLMKAGRVVAIEVDEEMVMILRDKLRIHPHFQLVHASVLDVDWARVVGTTPEPVKLIGNLPYHLTSPILRKLCAWKQWSFAIVMVQKEVGDRLCAPVDTPDYGALTVGMNLTCRLERVFDLSENSFKPPPRVKSTVVKITRRDQPLTDTIDAVQKVIQAAFQQRRKTILNSLTHGLKLEKPVVQQALAQLGISEQLRPQTLPVEAFIRLSEVLKIQ